MAPLPALGEVAPATATVWRIVAIGERAASVFLLVALIPFLLFSAAAIRALSGRSPLIAHRRVGWRGEMLWMLKLRTMWDRTQPAGRASGWIEYVDDDPGPAEKHAQDPRVAHWFARFCRRHSIDEIPQLWHVILGEMALVGPRPVTAAEIRQYYGKDAEEVLQVKPGIAGLWQTSGRNRLTYSQRRELDLRFVRERSLGMYVRILVRTLPEVWSGANSW